MTEEELEFETLARNLLESTLSGCGHGLHSSGSKGKGFAIAYQAEGGAEVHLTLEGGIFYAELFTQLAGKEIRIDLIHALHYSMQASVETAKGWRERLRCFSDNFDEVCSGLLQDLQTSFDKRY